MEENEKGKVDVYGRAGQFIHSFIHDHNITPWESAGYNTGLYNDIKMQFPLCYTHTQKKQTLHMKCI